MLQQLGADAFYKAGRQAGTPWTRLMDECLEKAASQLGRTPADVQAALHATPFHPELVALLRRVAAAGAGSSGSSGADGGAAGSAGGAIDVAVISDANTVSGWPWFVRCGTRLLLPAMPRCSPCRCMSPCATHASALPACYSSLPQPQVYIDTILAHHGLAPAVLEVHSNPAEWRGGALRVGPYHTAPHGCRHCPSNLCKGQVSGQGFSGLVGLVEGWTSMHAQGQYSFWQCLRHAGIGRDANANLPPRVCACRCWPACCSARRQRGGATTECCMW